MTMLSGEVYLRVLNKSSSRIKIAIRKRQPDRSGNIAWDLEIRDDVEPEYLHVQDETT